MSKALALSATGVGASSIVVGSYYLASMGSGTGTEGDSDSKESNTSQTNLSFKDLEDFKKEPSKVDCVKNLFSSLQAAGDSTPDIASSQPGADSFFKNVSGSDTSHNGCLLVEYKKETYDEDKWKGTILWLGTFVSGDEGFINFNMAETSDAGKLKFTGIFYLVGKKTGDDNNAWEIKYKSDATAAAEVESSAVDDYFPKPSSTLTGATKDYGGFFTNKDDDFKKICSNNSCTKVKQNTSGDPKKFSGTKKDSQDKLLKDWSDKLDWGSKLYSNANAHWNLPDKIKGFKGEWQEVKSQTNP